MSYDPHPNQTEESILLEIRVDPHMLHTVRPEPYVRKTLKWGRNQPCFCGSGIKFKRCHGRGQTLP